MSDATFYLVPRAAILASGDSDDFHHVEYREVASCPPGTWTMNTCVPVGCQWDYREHRWECRP